MLSRRGFVFDQDRCIGCKACVLACKNEHGTGENVWWRRLSNLGGHRYLSVSCNHCDSPECFRVCPKGAYSKGQDGVVLIDSSRCDGCGLCVNACPYHAPQFDALRAKVSKCNYCYERRQRGEIPACIAACPTGALKAADLENDDLTGTVATVEGFPDIYMTRPSVRFRPYRKHRHFWLDH